LRCTGVCWDERRKCDENKGMAEKRNARGSPRALREFTRPEGYSLTARSGLRGGRMTGAKRPTAQPLETFVPVCLDLPVLQTKKGRTNGSCGS
jgi:hypothetical protein